MRKGLRQRAPKAVQEEEALRSADGKARVGNSGRKAGGLLALDGPAGGGVVHRDGALEWPLPSGQLPLV